MGTERRLKKLVKEQAGNMGHDLGCWHYKLDGLWVARCMKCNLMAAIFAEDNVDPEEIHNVNKSFMINGIPTVNPSRIQWLSGATWDEVHPERSKGTISGMILSVQCDVAVKSQMGRVANSHLLNKP